MRLSKEIIQNITISLAIILLGFGAYSGYTTYYRRDKVETKINTVPATAKVTLNDKVMELGTHYLKPGYYNVSVSNDGFITHEEVLLLEKSSQVINIALSPESKSASEWVEQNNDAYLEYEQIAGQEAVSDGQEFREKNPITENLPYSNLIFTIGYRKNQSDPTGDSIIIEIKAAEGYRQSAINQIEQWGYNPYELNINFKGLDNPFAL